MSFNEQLAKLVQSQLKEFSAGDEKKKRQTLLGTPSQFSPTNFINEVSPHNVAEQVCMIEFDVWKNLEPAELMNQSWTKPDLRHKSPHVVELIQRFNSMSHWTASTILWQEKLAERVKVLAKFIDIAAELHRLNNFNSLLEILSGINNASVRRLKFTFAELSKKHKETLEKIETAMNPRQNYAQYRKLLPTFCPPVLPYLGSYLTLLTFIEDGNKDTANGLINWNKRRLFYQIIEEIDRLQQTPYNFKIQEPIFVFLSYLPIYDQEELHKISLIREPKTVDNKRNLT